MDPFDHIAILVSIILGLGITQLLSSFTDLLYHHRRVTFYWPQTAWVLFVLFLHVQDWFITYQLRTRTVWTLPDLFVVLSYPIGLFCVAKLLLPTRDQEEQHDMRSYFLSQFRMIGVLMLFCIAISIVFNLIYLEVTLLAQLPLFAFFGILLVPTVRGGCSERGHQLLAWGLVLSSLVATLVAREEWAVR
jgi:hypothetical protein